MFIVVCVCVYIYIYIYYIYNIYSITVMFIANRIANLSSNPGKSPGGAVEYTDCISAEG